MNKLPRLYIIPFLLLLVSCSESGPENYPPPTISFLTGEDYTWEDTTLQLNETVRIGIESSSMSEGGLTLFHIRVEMDGEITRIDSGLNSPSLSISKTLTKGTAEKEMWFFYTRDRDGRQSDTLSLNLYLAEGSEYGHILRYDTLVLGAQDSPVSVKMLSLPDAVPHTLEEAAGNQANIWLLYYYDNIDKDQNTLASPGANIDASIYDLGSWSVKNTSRFLLVENINEEEFLSSANDSLILEHTFEFAGGKRKAKKLAAGQYHSFVTEDNRRGMIRILEVDGTETGSVKFQMICQK